MQNLSLDVEKVVLELLRAKFQGNPDEIEVKAETDIFAEYGLDSMDVLDFTLQLSKKLDISFGESIDDIESLVTFGTLLNRVNTLLEGQAVSACIN